MKHTVPLYDLVIVGAGPAGLSAAIYAGRAKLKTLVLEKSEIGGQVKITSEVRNYPGVFNTSGQALTEEMKRQALSFGVEFRTGDIVDVNFSNDIKKLGTTSGEKIQALGVIIATGARPRKLGFEGEQEFAGRGIGYCATCDGEFFTGKRIFVIGAGFAAAEEALFLTRFAKKVTIIAREPEFTCSKTIADRVLAHDDIEVRFNTELQYVRGKGKLQEAQFINNQTSEVWDYQIPEDEGSFGVFVFVGYEPLSEAFADHVSMDSHGYILANEDMETDISGVWAAGDIRPKRLRQLTTAVADGSIAATSAEPYIEALREKLGITVEHDISGGGDESELSGDYARLRNSHDGSPPVQAGTEVFFSEETSAQILSVMERLESKPALHAILRDDDQLSGSIRHFLDQFAAITEHVDVQFFAPGEVEQLEAELEIPSPSASSPPLLPIIALIDSNGAYTGISFNGVPGGHELESLVLAIYNVAGPGQTIDDALLSRLQDLPAFDLQVGVSLSCTMCPDVVQACQRIAALNPRVRASMIDLGHFPQLREQHEIMSVPALIVNGGGKDSEVFFGKKGLDEVVTLLEARAGIER